MGKQQIGVVKNLFRYPIKSMRGERPSEVYLSEQGVLGDRIFALREVGGRIVSAKNLARMLECRAYYDEPLSTGDLPRLLIDLPDGRTIDTQTPDISIILSQLFGRDVVLERTPTEQDSPAEFDLDGATIFGDVPVEEVVAGQTAQTMPSSWAMVAGSFFDEFKVTLLASGTLNHLHKLIGEDAKIDARRFRPNILVETTTENASFVEDGWLNGTLEVGETTRLVHVKPNIRCIMTTHQQDDLPRDMRIIRSAVQHHRNYVGVGAVVDVPGQVHVGDPVILVM